MPEMPLPDCHVPASTSVGSGAEWQQQYPSWLLAGLKAGSVTDHGGAEEGQAFAVEVHRLGELPLPDGRLIGCDPYLADLTRRPFDLALPPGEHPVGVAIVRIAADHIRPAALLLSVSSAPIARWSLAQTVAEPTSAPDDPDDDPATFEVGAILGYGVDAGTGALLSPSALPALVEVGNEDGGMLEDPLSVAMEESPIEAVLVAPRPGALVVAQCHSGWGDGVYATWVGWDEGGGVSLVMTDFAVVSDPWNTDDDASTAAEPAAAAERQAASPSSGGFWSRLFGRRDR